MNIEEVKKDLEEIRSFLAQSTRQKVKDVLTVAERKFESEILHLEEIKGSNVVQEAGGSIPKSALSAPENKRYITELQEYAWDQSDKFVKLFVTLNGIQKLSESDINTVFTENSIKLTIANLNGKDYCLTINNLLAPIDVEKSYYKIKTDMVAVYMKKQQESSWSHLTLTEKRLKEIKDSQFKTDDDSDLKDDPTAGLMNLMKKMYQSGDPEMKRMIAKAWTESQEKSREKMEL